MASHLVSAKGRYPACPSCSIYNLINLLIWTAAFLSLFSIWIQYEHQDRVDARKHLPRGHRQNRHSYTIQKPDYPAYDQNQVTTRWFRSLLLLLSFTFAWHSYNGWAARVVSSKQYCFKWLRSPRLVGCFKQTVLHIKAHVKDINFLSVITNPYSCCL